MLSVMLDCVVYAHVQYVSVVIASDSDTDDANIEPTQLTEPRCDCSWCSISVKTKAVNEIRYKSTGADKKRKVTSL